ncbi:unnamed protein product [Heligmosomoides polygyrus]|uniref:Neur_chan_memb domain-containing protein n=1 Tax=Heligmosomoides polygyrus TaxID=6339 RepID=A0A183F354_HELPZ|nr:unnamed protein product [Heligmosomoides polygyrus]
MTRSPSVHKLLDATVYCFFYCNATVILIAEGLKWFYVTSAVCLVAVLMERACASYFIADYEKKARRWISTVIIGFSLIMSMVLTITFMFSEWNNILKKPVLSRTMASTAMSITHAPRRRPIPESNVTTYMAVQAVILESAVKFLADAPRITLLRDIVEEFEWVFGLRNDSW